MQTQGQKPTGYPKQIANLILALFLYCPLSMAALGDSEDSVEKDRKTLSGTRSHATTQDSYSVHEISTEGLTVREYVSSHGVVFGITWKGISHPDLSSILGSYTEEFQTANKHAVKPQGHRSHSATQTSHIVVEKSGHMRSVQGRAFIPALIPKGVSADEIQ